MNKIDEVLELLKQRYFYAAGVPNLIRKIFGIENEGRRRYNGSRILTSVDKKSPASKAVG